MDRIAFVTTCKGRLHHLRETLPTLLAEAPDEVVVVDYGCPDGTADWVENDFPGVGVVRVVDDPGFCVARARNLGALATTTEWICFIDVDVRVEPGWLAWLRAHLHERCFVRAASLGDGYPDAELEGTIVCRREHFDLAGGYDEVFRGWGGEDKDFRMRLLLQRLGEVRYPLRFLRPIRHSDSERFRYAHITHKGLSIVITELYVLAKQFVLGVQGGCTNPPLELRRSLMQQIEKQVCDWKADPVKPLPDVIRLNVEGFSWLPEPYSIRKQVSFTLSITQAKSGLRPD